MATISKETYHRLPTSNFKGFITKGQPHFKNVNWGQGWNASQMGFWEMCIRDRIFSVGFIISQVDIQSVL